MRPSRPLLLPTTTLLLLGAIGGCTRFGLRTERDPSADFSRFATFAWMGPDVAPVGDQYLQDPYIERRVRQTVDAALGAKGYRLTDEDDSDLLLTYRLLSDDRLAGTLPAGYRGYYLGPWAAGYDSFEEGTLIIDAVERDVQRLVWRGSASARLLPHYDFEQRAARAKDAVERIMAGFPAR
jgi:hypothetical protein